MTFEAYFERTRTRLLRFLDGFLESKKAEMARPEPWGKDVVRRLDGFTRKGKLIRGGLVCLGCEMAGRRISEDAVRTGAALELIQSALLIHDDIMDRDAQRRGAPSLHRQYALLAEKEGLPDADHFGVSMGICAGEIAIFLAFEALAGLSARPDRAGASEVQRLFAGTFGLVGLGQMRDIHAGASSRPVPEKEILDIYRFKTARYSFSLPLAAGWVLGGGRASVRRQLERLGEAMGLIFQIKDDELGLFGEEEVLGKPVGSDIRQGKKTLIHLRLLERATAGERKRLTAVFGRQDASEEDIRAVRELALRYGVDSDVRRTMARYGRRAGTVIGGLPVDSRYREVLETLLAFSLTRRK
jgi:geranylgeranyl diphosphate synthase, type I